MSVRGDLINYLLGRAAIIALVEQRIFRVKRPQGDRALPAIVISRISGGHGHLLDGGAGWAQASFQLSVFADTNAAAETVAEAVRDAMQGFIGGVWGSTEVDSVTLTNELDLYEADATAGDNGTHHLMLEYLIVHTVSVPDPN